LDVVDDSRLLFKLARGPLGPRVGLKETNALFLGVSLRMVMRSLRGVHEKHPKRALFIKMSTVVFSIGIKAV